MTDARLADLRELIRRRHDGGLSVPFGADELLAEVDRLRARDLSMREWLRTLLVKVDAILNGPTPVDFDEAARRAREAEERRG